MIELTDLQSEIDSLEISNIFIDLIVDKIVNDMIDRIEKIDPDDDPSAEYDNYWSCGNYSGDDYFELDGLEVDYKYKLSWECRVWTEYWTDPICEPSFSEKQNETGYIYNIEICTSDGDPIKQSICDAIVKQVNDKIK